jgi:hypothetical protein
MYIKTWKIIVGCVLALILAGIAFTSIRNYAATHYDHQYTQR